MTNTIEGKIYIPPKKSTKALAIFIKVCVVIVIVLSIFRGLMEGFKVQNIIVIVIGIAVWISKGRSIQEEGYFETCFINVTKNDDRLEFSYSGKTHIVTFETSNINSIAYSKQNECLQIIGKYTETIGNKKYTKDGEYLIYSKFEKQEELLSNLQGF